MLKCVGGRGSAPDPAGGAHNAPPDPIVWGGVHPSPDPPLRLWCLNPSACCARFSTPVVPLFETFRRPWSHCHCACLETASYNLELHSPPARVVSKSRILLLLHLSSNFKALLRKRNSEDHVVTWRKLT